MATYVWADHAFVNIKADVAAEEFEKLAEDGEVTRSRVVDAARSEDSPLHPAFIWDDAVAAQIQREDQAGYMLRSLRIIKAPDEPPRRVYYNIQTGNIPGYMTTARVLSDEGLHQALLYDAWKSLIAVRARYEELSELATIWDAIDKHELSRTG